MLYSVVIQVCTILAHHSPTWLGFRLQEKKVKEDQIKYLTAVQDCYCKLKATASKMVKLEANMRKYSEDIKRAVRSMDTGLFLACLRQWRFYSGES